MEAVAGALVGGVVSGLFASDAADTQADAANRAADLQSQANRDAIQEQRRQFDLARSDQAPWLRDAGIPAVRRMSDMLRLTDPTQPYPSMAYGAPTASGAPSAAGKTLQDFITELTPRYTTQGTAPTIPAPTGAKDALGRPITDIPAGGYPGSDGWQWQQSGPTVDTAGLNAEAQRLFIEAQRAAGAQNAGSGSAGQPRQQGLQAGLEMDPGYQFRLGEGNKAIDRAAAARGGFVGGRALKDLTRYGQNFASGEFTNAWNRLGQMAGYGQQVNQQMGPLGMQMAGNIGGMLTDAASAQGAAGMIGANARGSAYQGIGNNIGNMIARQPWSTPGYGGYSGGFSESDFGTGNMGWSSGDWV